MELMLVPPYTPNILFDHRRFQGDPTRSPLKDVWDFPASAHPRSIARPRVNQMQGPIVRSNGDSETPTANTEARRWGSIPGREKRGTLAATWCLSQPLKAESLRYPGGIPQEMC